MVSYTFLFVIIQAFVLVSQTQATCLQNIYVQHGKVDYGYSYYIVSCDPGYELVGKRAVYCDSNNWDSRPPICSDGMFCPLPQPLTHGTVIDCTSQDLPRIGDKCSFRCNNGYKLRGPSSLICTASKRYVDEEGYENFPECVVDDENRQNVATLQNHNYHSSYRKNEEIATSLDIDNNPCKNLGGCAHVCKNVNGLAKCRCRQGFTLAADQKTCIETLPESESVQYETRSDSSRLSDQHRTLDRSTDFRNEENRPRNSNDPCKYHQCDHICRIEKGRAQCRCEKGFILNKEDQRSCDKNLGPPIHHPNPCTNNNGGCDHKCRFVGYGRATCDCNGGYYLDKDRKSCIASPTKPAPVTCSVNNGGCEYYCSPRWNTIVCSCPQGYKLDTDRKHCVASPTCHINNGGCQYYCQMRDNTAICRCPSGYRLDTDKKHCVDINECAYERLNSCQHICENHEGGYTCRCRQGYFLTESHKCEGCKKNSYWSHEIRGCVECPANSFTLSDGKTSVGDCICNLGFTGSPKDGIPCTDVDECAIDNFGCSHECVNIPGDAFCSCPEGYMVDKNNKTCIDINECTIKNGGCEGLCINTEGSFHCKCLPGFKPSNKDHYSCDDVNECEENNGGCEQLCHNYRGGYYCGCREGYRLEGSQKNCTDISCPALPVPHFSTMTCKNNKEALPGMDNYPTGTICSFKCISGFKDVSQSNKMKCLDDGTWEGSLSECKSQHCPPLEVPENGDVHPPSCATVGNTVKQKCTFTCRQGYRLDGISVFSCKNNLSWTKSMKDIPVCQPEDIRASVECTRDVTATLLPGKSSHNVTIPEPVTNMESYEIFPAHIKVGEPFEFEAGKTKVVFTANSPGSNRTAKCVTIVHVVDEEPPVFLSCPDSIVIKDAKVDGEIVTWNVPEVTDNVKVESLKSSVEPNTTLAPGSYIVQYVARDTAGNTEACSFKIDIVRLSCENLTNPVHGEANCMDWLYGHLCQPLCDDGYMRNPSDPQFYTCGDSGVWEPSEQISDCLPFTEAESSECPDGSELKIISETEEEICLECRSDAIWSSATRTCEEVTT